MDEMKQPLPEVPKPPEQPEVPEEGFVPYCAEVNDSAGTHNRKAVFLIVLLLLTVIGVIVILTGRTHNLYHETISALQFDYRNGEQTSAPDETANGTDAAELAQNSKDMRVKIAAYLYEFDEDEKLSQTVAQYQYDYTANEEQSLVRVGTSRWFGTGETHCRHKYREGYEYEKGSKWIASNDAYFPPLYAYCFGIKSGNGIKYDLYQSYRSYVNNSTYDCEIWLMTDETGAEPLYLTLYRYYQNGQLAAVRVLNNLDARMQVYDIRNYQFY